MPCITPNHDLAVIFGEDLLNLLIGKFYADRPQPFRRVSRGMDGVTPFDTVFDAMKIGETGHAIEYEFRITAPADGKFVDLDPAQDARTGVAAQPGGLLFKAGILIRLWDPQPNRRWQFDFPVTVSCVLQADQEDEVFSVDKAVVAGFLPPPLQEAVNYAVLQLVRGALKHVTLPGNFLFSPPAAMRLQIDTLIVANDLLQVDATVSFSGARRGRFSASDSSRRIRTQFRRPNPQEISLTNHIFRKTSVSSKRERRMSPSSCIWRPIGFRPRFKTTARSGCMPRSKSISHRYRMI